MASRVVDRQREIEQLRSYAAAPPALVVLSGRRRVGKSFLLRVALTGDRVVSLQAEQKPAPLQLGDFARECSRLLPGSPPLAFADWEAAFRFVHAQAEAGGPLVVVLDEFQYLAQNTDGLDTIVQKWWDRWDHEGMPVMLVLSGSALSFMEGLLKTGTHGRSVFRPLLQPLDFRDAASFAPKAAGPIELIERYAVLGGTPQYQRWAGDRPLRDVLREVVLPTDAPLHSDPEHLIREEDEIRTAGPYFGTLEAIAGGATTPTEIGGRLALDTQLVTAHLNRLAKLGYVEKVMPVDPDGKGSARAYWRTRTRSSASGFASSSPSEAGSSVDGSARSLSKSSAASPASPVSSSRMCAVSGSAVFRRSAAPRAGSALGGVAGATWRLTSPP